jgi:hypothetical protein
MWRQTRKRWLAILLLSAAVGACVTLTGTKSRHVDRGLLFKHATHPATDLACTDCHAVDNDEPKKAGHEICSACHDEQVNLPADSKLAKTDPKACGLCHVNPDQSVKPRAKLLEPEQKFAHAPHVAKEIACPTCHPSPDKGALPAGSIMAFCTDCHGKTRRELNECKVCHSEIDKNVRPKSRNGIRIPHDVPQIWETVHGQQYKNDPAFCAMCHEQESHCEECHRKNPPSNHTVAWRRKSHGLRATWDREKCSACHEEDFCIKCHQSAEPSSHRGGWGAPGNRHCLVCHYPVRDTNCTACHEVIEHASAPHSPHERGLYPVRCLTCHPGGDPSRAPHPVNSTAGCMVCHE